MRPEKGKDDFKSCSSWSDVEEVETRSDGLSSAVGTKLSSGTDFKVDYKDD